MNEGEMIKAAACSHRDVCYCSLRSVRPFLKG
jgi:hypothetical protein